ncbi:HTH-type transcriptional regulator Xre [compost metagenome]
MKEFAKRLKHLREKQKVKDSKWTQGYVADLIGVARPTYTAYENGTKQPPLETVDKIANLFNVSSDYLIGRTNNSAPLHEENINVAFYDGYDELSPEEQEAVKEIVKNTIETFKKMKAERANKK